MLKMYGSPICSGCVAVKEQFAAQNIPYEFVNITESIPNLRAFLKLRDTREELRAAKEEGRVCLPTFEFEDGTITMDLEEVYARLERETAEPREAEEEAPAFCSADGHC